MKTFDITAVSKLKHAALWIAAKQHGSQSALARALGICPSELGEWINLKSFPRRNRCGRGNSRRTSEWFDDLDAKLLEHVGKGLDELFPDELQDAESFLKANKTVETTRSIPINALLSYAGHTRDRLTYDQEAVDAAIDGGELRERIGELLKTLNYREREIIKLRYGLSDGVSYTFEEVGHVFKVTRERIRQIEHKALRKLQQPSRAEKLVDWRD